MYSPSVLDIKEEDLLSKVKTGLANITALSLQTHYPTEVHFLPLLLWLVCAVVNNCLDPVLGLSYLRLKSKFC